MKKWIKKCSLWIVAFGAMFLLRTSVKAVNLNIYNGTDVPSGWSPGDCSVGYKYGLFCKSNQYKGTRISVIYYDGSKYEMLGQSIDIFPNSNVIKSGDKYFSQTGNNKVGFTFNGKKPAPSLKVSGVPKSSSSYFGIQDFSPIGSSYKYAIVQGMPVSGRGEREFWSKKFLEETVETTGAIIEDSLGNQIIMATTGHSLSDNEFWSRPTETALPEGGGINRIGYRILIEPITIHYTEKNGRFIMTPTEYASLAWNVNTFTTLEQVAWYIESAERMVVEFDDVGIKKTTKCNNCLAEDAQFPGRNRLGHAVHIIDLSNIISNQCDYETGAGFPPMGQTLQQLGRELEEQEILCCEQKAREIIEKYKVDVNSTQCMITSKTVPQFIGCMNSYFTNQALIDKNWLAQKLEMDEFLKKYPACAGSNCDYTQLLEIEKEYRDCTSTLDISTWMANILMCKETSCEVNYSQKLVDYQNKHELCDIKEWEDKLYTNQCKLIIDKPVSGCDENNPSHFPSSSNNYDKTCCLYFENKMKVEYKNQGLSQSEIDRRIESWFNEKDFRKNCLLQKCNIEDETLTEACCEELKVLYPEKSEAFWTKKGCKFKDDKNKCKWVDYTDPLIKDLEVAEKGNCAIKTSVEIRDTENWDCIFDSDNIKKGSGDVEIFRDYYLKYNNPYCAVYCREDVKYDFPAGNMIVKAGNHFTVGNTGILPEWSPIQFTSTRECRTTGSTNDEKSTEINTKKFEQDWIEANEKVIKTWELWKKAQLMDRADSTSTPGSDCCVSRVNKACILWGTRYTYTEKVYFDGELVNKGNSYCAVSQHRDHQTELRRKNHVKAKEDMHTIENDILACTSWKWFDNYLYTTPSNSNVKAERYTKYDFYQNLVDYEEFNPDLLIDYDEPTYSAYNYEDDLEKDVKPTKTESNFSVTGALFSTKYECIEGTQTHQKSCKRVRTFQYSPQSEAHATYTKQIKYQLKEDVFNTILKPQGIAISGSDNENSTDQVYVDLGYSALHVHFMTPSGRYVKKSGAVDSPGIGLYYVGFTPKENEGNFDHNFDNDKFGFDQFGYDCSYVVENEIIENEDPNCEGDNCLTCGSDNCTTDALKGLNLIYRPISLSNPFPGINGEGRSPGKNWAGEGTVETFITNNRGVKENRIYYDTYPMYQITLTPALIRKIREYNENTTYNDFNMDCLESSGRECKSLFIRGNTSSESSNDSYDFSKYFEKCKKSSSRDEVTCCGIGNWNDCAG